MYLRTGSGGATSEVDWHKVAGDRAAASAPSAKSAARGPSLAPWNRDFGAVGPRLRLQQFVEFFLGVARPLHVELELHAQVVDAPLGLDVAQDLLQGLEVLL